VTTAVLEIAGLVMNLVGVVLLFLFGMPYRLRTGGDVATWRIAKRDPAIVSAERRYTILGWAGLILIVVGTGAQIAAVIKG